ncbi:MAG: hypothetical protein B5M56_04725 [Desulfococcus sp. 4484_241]|nr:MAG: hypothetical protein B5M56_04725 [Desulfococcus sp. 4484_241]
MFRFWEFYTGQPDGSCGKTAGQVNGLTNKNRIILDRLGKRKIKSKKAVIRVHCGDSSFGWQAYVLSVQAY